MPNADSAIHPGTHGRRDLAVAAEPPALAPNAPRFSAGLGSRRRCEIDLVTRTGLDRSDLEALADTFAGPAGNRHLAVRTVSGLTNAVAGTWSPSSPWRTRPAR